MFSSHAISRAFATSALFLALMLGLPQSGAAQSGDLALLSGGTKVPPNVMIVYDTSGSMQHIIWEETFDRNRAWDRDAAGTPAITNNDFTNCWRRVVGGNWVQFTDINAIAGTDNQCPGSGLPNDACAQSDYPERFEISGTDHEVACLANLVQNPCAGFSAGDCYVSGSWMFLTLHDLDTGGPRTWWSHNYLHWYMQQLMAAGPGGFPIPQQTRDQGAKKAVDILVNDVNPDDGTGGYIENVKFGLARFNGSTGGYVRQPIGQNNKTALLNALFAISPGGWTPLSETMTDVGRYFVGEHQNLGNYSAYNLNTSGSATSSPPKSPIDTSLSCQMNFAILMTDGVPTQDLNNHHGTAFATTIGDWDGDGDALITMPDSGSDYLDDVAGYLYNTDLIDDTIAAGTQNIVTYTVGFSVDLPILQQAAQNGGGGYYTTSNATVLAAQLKDALQEIIERSTTFSAASVPSSRTAFGDGFFTAYFQPSSVDAFWAGHLEAYRLGPNFEIFGKNNQVAIDPSTGAFLDPRIPIWDVGLKLAGLGGYGAHPTRNLYTVDGAGALKNFDAASVDFTEMGVVAGDLGLYPEPVGPYANEEALADTLVDFLWGQDKFDEDGDLDVTELRTAVLGDIFHSNPIVVGTPPPYLLGEEGFGSPGSAPDPTTSFFGRYALRDRRLYVGANDGMFHAVRAGTFEQGDNPATPTVTEVGYYDLEEVQSGMSGGDEAFGYVPRFLMPKLKEIPFQTLNNKVFFVDGDSTAADAWLPNNGNDVVKDMSEWATVGIASMRRGGRGYAGLDITDPSGQFRNYPSPLWEFVDPNEPLGESWSKAVIARVRMRGGPGGDYCDSGVLPAPDCREQWVAIFAGGYTDTGDPSLPTFILDPNDPAFESAGKALFMVDVKTGALISKIEFDPADAQMQNWLFATPSNPAVLDIDFDGFVDLIYVGDLGGQLWKWDVSDIGQRNVSTGLVDNWRAGIFFQVPVANNGHHMSVFNSPTASYISGELTLAFGTGERTKLDYTSDHANDGDANRFYVVADPDPTGSTSIPSSPYSETDITEITASFTDPDPSDLGFFMVAEDGEKFVTNHIAFAGFLITASFTPDSSITDPCSSGTGEAFLYVFDLQGGGGFFSDDGTGPLSTRRLALGSGLPTDPRITSSGTHGGGNKIFVQTSDGGVAIKDGPDGGEEPVGLVYWRQQL